MESSDQAEVSSPISLTAAVGKALHNDAEYRAGGTDVEERRRLGISSGPVVDLKDIPELSGITEIAGGGYRIGAMTRLEELRDLANNTALAGAIDIIPSGFHLLGTIGGELLQHTKCWYYRHPDGNDCHKRGGSRCLAWEGDHLLGSLIQTGDPDSDQGVCVWPHPSILAPVFLAQAATVSICGNPDRTIHVGALYGDGADPSRDHQLDKLEILTHINVPVSERSAFTAVRDRSDSPYPLVWVSGALVGEVVRLAAGGIANVPYFLGEYIRTELNPDRSKNLLPRFVWDDVPTIAATEYKKEMLTAAVGEILEQLDVAKKGGNS